MPPFPPDPGVAPPDEPGTAPPRTADPARGLHETRLALAHARRAASEARLQSHRLHARAADALHVAVATRDFAVSHRELWEGWHRAWAALVASHTSRLLRVCVYCGAAVLERTDPATSGAWGPVPPWVRDRLHAGGLGVRPTHGACPSCADAWLDRA